MHVLYFRIRLLVAVAFLSVLADNSGFAQELCGVHVTPHQFSSEMRWRRPPNPELAAKVELFLLNRGDGDCSLSKDTAVLFDGQRTEQLLDDEQWSWHDSPSSWLTDEESLPPNGMAVFTINGKSAKWGVGTTHQLQIGARPTIEFEINQPQAWLSAVTFLSDPMHGQEPSIHPNRIVVHIANDATSALHIQSLRLWLPKPNTSHHVLYLARTYDELDCFPNHRSLPGKDKGGFSVRCEPLPLTYAAVEVRVQRPGQDEQSLWSYLRIKREVFDISGGWVASDVGGRNSLTIDEYRQTLKRMHVNTGQIEEVSGFTDDSARYAELPLKRFNRLWPLSRYDTDELLPTIHAVEFLGEPQYGGGRPVPPQEVWEKLAPYQPSRLPSSITLSEEHSWRYYAGLSDYPHYDAYRVTAPAADSWRRYDRWNGEQIGWGAPLETIGTMTRSLRDLNRPRPIAYWSQGAHDGWGSRWNPRRGSPTPDELRSQAWHGLANRITSLYWFNLSLKSIVKFPDLIDPITRVNREIHMLEDIFLCGDAYEYRRIESDRKPAWDVNSIASHNSALLVAHDLQYRADTETLEFRFQAREAVVSFARPNWLTGQLSVFKVDADGTHDVSHAVSENEVEIRDQINVVGIYVATTDQSLRKRIESLHQELIQIERDTLMDPGNHAADLTRLKSYLRK